MSNSTVKGRPTIRTLQNLNLYDFMESLDKLREEGEAKLYEYMES